MALSIFLVCFLLAATYFQAIQGLTSAVIMAVLTALCVGVVGRDADLRGRSHGFKGAKCHDHAQNYQHRHDHGNGQTLNGQKVGGRE